MKNLLTVMMLACGVVLATPVTAMAHPHEDGVREFDPAKARERFEESRAKREEILKKVQEVREERIREAFELSEKQYGQLFEILDDFDQVRFDAQGNKRMAMLELRAAMSEENPDAKVVEKQLDALEQAEAALVEARLEKMKRLKKVLEPVQRAEFLAAERRFEHQVKRRIRGRMMEHRRGQFGDGPNDRERFERRRMREHREYRDDL